MHLQFQIQYKKGLDNRCADVLSHRPDMQLYQAHLQLNLCSISVSKPVWLAAVQQGYLTDPQAQALLATLASDEPKNNYYPLTDGVIRYKGQVWLSNDTKIQEQVMLALHSSPLGGSFRLPSYLQATESLVCMAADETRCAPICYFLHHFQANKN
jgi:hypothetical protein